MRRALLPALLAALSLAPSAGAWTWPAGGPVLQPFVFDPAHPYAAGQHRGIDVGAAAGSPVLAPASGTVTFAGSVPSSGRSVTIETDDGYSVTLTHLGSITVSRDAAVVEGAPVASIGPSGDAELAQPYVHLGVRLSAQEQGYLDPLSLLPARPVAPPPDPASAPAPGPAPVSAPTPGAATVPAVSAASDPVPAPVPAASPGPAATAPAAPVAIAAQPTSAVRAASRQQVAVGAAPDVALRVDSVDSTLRVAARPAAKSSERSLAPRRAASSRRPSELAGLPEPAAARRRDLRRATVDVPVQFLEPISRPAGARRQPAVPRLARAAPSPHRPALRATRAVPAPPQSRSFPGASLLGFVLALPVALAAAGLHGEPSKGRTYHWNECAST